MIMTVTASSTHFRHFLEQGLGQENSRHTDTLGEFGPDGDRLSQRFSGVVVFALRGLSHGLVIELFGVVGLYWRKSMLACRVM